MVITSYLPVELPKTLRALARQTRLGYDTESPQIIRQFVETASVVASTLDGKELRQTLYYEVLNTLLETISDSCIDRHWREQCLNYVYQPIFALQRLATNDDQRARLNMSIREINILGQYFL